MTAFSSNIENSDTLVFVKPIDRLVFNKLANRKRAAKKLIEMQNIAVFFWILCGKV